MNLKILKLEWWRERLFKKNKISEELPKRSEKFNKIKARIDEAIDIQSNGGWKLTEEEQKIQKEFTSGLFKKIIGKNKDEAVEILKKINKRFPEIIKNFMKSNSEAEEMKKMHKEMERTNEEKEKETIFDVLKPFTQEHWKEQPKTLRNFSEQLYINDVERTPRVIDKEREESLLKALKNLERYFPSYKPENKEKASKLFEKMLKRPDIKKREEIQKRIETLIDQAKS